MKKLLYVLFLSLIVFTVTSCKKDEENDTDDTNQRVSLNMAINHKESGQPFTTITYQRDTIYTSTINNKEYKKGDLLPVWEAIGEKLNIEFIQKAAETDKDTKAQWERAVAEGFKNIDIINASNMSTINEEGLKGNFIDLSKHLDKMPNFKDLLDKNPDVRKSITTNQGAIYGTPYFDGLGEIHRSLMARIDWVEDILDTTKPGDSTPAAPLNYPKQVTDLNYSVVVANADETTRTVNKVRTKNIIDVLNDAPQTGAGLLNAFREYFNTVYGNQGYSKLSHVFTGIDASYDIDELIALWRVVKSNPKLVTNQQESSVAIYFPRQANANRVKDLFGSLHVLFGLRGTNSYNTEWLYINDEGNLEDVRNPENTRFLDVVDIFSNLYKDEYIPQNPTDSTDYRKKFLENSNGFMSYDLNATSTTDALIDAAKKKDPDYNYQMILPPVHNWRNDGKYFHFTEAIRSVQQQSWGIVSHGMKNNETKLNRAIQLFDQMYDTSTEDSVGTIHLYGPKGWTDGKITEGPYKDQNVYKLSEKAIEEMMRIHAGNNIRYQRQIIGATLAIGHIRSLGLEYQILSQQGLDGFHKMESAKKAGTYVYAGSEAAKKYNSSWYDIVPSSLPLSTEDLQLLEQVAGFRKVYDTTGNAPLIDLLKFGFNETNSRTLYKNRFVGPKNEDYYKIYIDVLNEAFKS